MSKRDKDWDGLYEASIAQCGYFTLGEAASHEITPQDLYQSKRVLKTQFPRVYRFTQCPPEEHEKCIQAYVWSEYQGVISHSTALTIHNLSDFLPVEDAPIEMILPTEFKKSRRSIPNLIKPYFEDIKRDEKMFHDYFDITTKIRTITDFFRSGNRADLVYQAIKQVYLDFDSKAKFAPYLFPDDVFQFYEQETAKRNKSESRRP